MVCPVRCYTTNGIIGECKPLYDALRKKKVPQEKIIEILHGLGFNKYPEKVHIITHIGFYEPLSGIEKIKK